MITLGKPVGHRGWVRFRAQFPVPIVPLYLGFGLLLLAALPLINQPETLRPFSAPGHRQPSPRAWLWLEGEDYAWTNMLAFNENVNNSVSLPTYCPACSDGAYIYFSSWYEPQHQTYQDHWYITYVLRPKQGGDYRNLWLATDNHTGPDFSLAIDGQPPVQARILARSEAYVGDLRWIKVGTSALDLDFAANSRHILRVIKVDPDGDPLGGQASQHISIDAIVLTVDDAWEPDGNVKPARPASYLALHQDLVVYHKNYTELVLPDTIPDEDEMVDTVSAFATIGEYEPLTFSIYALRDLKEVKISLTELASDQGDTIPLENLDLRIVRVLDKRIARQAEPDQRKPFAELLDHPDQVDIDASRPSRRYWLTVKVPGDIPPRDEIIEFTGTATITGSNFVNRQITLKLHLFPFQLSEPDQIVYDIRYEPVTEVDGFTRRGTLAELVSLDLADHRAHGLNSLSLAIPFRLDGGEGDLVDFEQFDLTMNALRDGGFDANRLVHYGQLGSIYGRLLESGLNREQADGELIDILSQIERKRLANDWPQIRYLVLDEPQRRTGAEIEQYIHISNLVHRSLPGIELAGSLPSYAFVDTIDRGDLPDMPTLDAITDVRVYNGWSLDGLLPVHGWDEIAREPDRAMAYYNTKGIPQGPAFYRVRNGFWLWRSGLQGQIAWRYRAIQGDPLDDADGAVGDLCFTYPDPGDNYNPNLPSLKWEGFREGIDDYRYLFTLSKGIAVAESAGVEEAIIAPARQVLSDLEAEIDVAGMEARSIEKYFNYDKYDGYRLRAAQQILNLRRAIRAVTPAASAPEVCRRLGPVRDPGLLLFALAYSSNLPLELPLVQPLLQRSGAGCN